MTNNYNVGLRPGLKEIIPTIDTPEVNTNLFFGRDIRECDEFAKAPIDYLVDGIIVSDQITLLAGASKSLKTTILCDLVVALVTGTKWLRKYAVTKKCSVLFITGENGIKSATRKIFKAAECRGFKKLADLPQGLRIETDDFPSLSSPTHKSQIQTLVERENFSIVIIDPLYRGLSGTDQSDVAARGDAIAQFAAACRPANLICSHHFTKGASRDQHQIKLPMLEDMTGAGVAEIAGNWVLINRNEPWRESYPHDLTLSIGNREGGGDAIRLIFDEYDWSSEITNFFEFKDNAKEKKRQDKLDNDAAKVHEFLRKRMDRPASKNAIREGVKISNKAATELLDQLGKNIRSVSPYINEASQLIQQPGYVAAENYEMAIESFWAKQKQKQKGLDYT